MGHVWSQDGFAEEPSVHGVSIPAPIDAHTHIADRLARGVDLRGLTLAEVVAPPDGLKHRLLRDAPERDLITGMRAAIKELLSAGTRTFVDFREQGERGAWMLREAARDLPARPVVFGRCAGAFDETEAAVLLREVDGYGWSGLGDAEGAERAATLAHRLKKGFALHLSEAQREDAGRALDLRPSFLVHMVHATRDDLEAVANARVPIVLCPRSNARFGGVPPVQEMLRAGVRLALGSDNAMFHELGVLHEARLLVAQGVAREDALRMALGGRAVVPDAAEEPIVLAPQGADPWDAIFGPRPPKVVTVGTKPS